MTGQFGWMSQWPARLSSTALPAPAPSLDPKQFGSSTTGGKRVRFMGSGSRSSSFLWSPDSKGRSCRTTTLSIQLSSGQGPQRAGRKDWRAPAPTGTLKAEPWAMGERDTCHLGTQRLTLWKKGCAVCSCTQARAEAKPSPPWGGPTLLGLIPSENSANPGPCT